MKSHKFPILGMAMLLAFASCKKNDLQDNTIVREDIENVQTKGSGENNSNSKLISSWNETRQEGFSVFHSNIADQKISGTVAENGLVLVYKINGSEVKALPLEEKIGSSSLYWYYMITEGNLMITVDAHGQQEAPSANSFKYFVVSPDQLKDLESKGFTRAKLMQMSFEEVSALF